MPLPFLICSQSDFFIQIVDINLHTCWQTVQIQISWLLQKPTDLDLHCLQKQDVSGFSRTRVNRLTKLLKCVWSFAIHIHARADQAEVHCCLVPLRCNLQIHDSLITSKKTKSVYIRHNLFVKITVKHYEVTLHYCNTVHKCPHPSHCQLTLVLLNLDMPCLCKIYKECP